MIVTRSEMTVRLVASMGNDAAVVAAARVSTKGATSLEDLGVDPAEAHGLINFLMKNRHGTPFEHNAMTFFVQAPVMVFREFHRHRIGWSYNEESARYKQLDPVFYVPDAGRALVQTGRPGHYRFEAGTHDQQSMVQAEITDQCDNAYAAYEAMLEKGIAKEVARSVLPVTIYSSMYATCNARSLMAFLSLRTKSDQSTFPSFPMREIEMVAEQMESAFAELFPITYAAFDAAGRVCP